MSPTYIAIACARACALGAIAGYLHGRARGEAYGWQDGFFERIARDRNSRNRLGQYRPKRERRA